MALLGPTTEDTVKLSNEIVQYQNHRFGLLVAAIALFGGFTAGIITTAIEAPASAKPPERSWVISIRIGEALSDGGAKTSENARGRVRSMAPLLCLLANFFYLAIHLVGLLILDDLLMTAAYLKKTGASRWEHDFDQYAASAKGKPWWRFGYGRSFVVTFLVMFGATSVLPVVLVLLYDCEDKASYTLLSTANFILGVAFFGLMIAGSSGGFLYGIMRTPTEWFSIWSEVDENPILEAPDRVAPSYLEEVGPSDSSKKPKNPG